ncbi:MAG TPA: hypothetical protein VN634_17460 [Candidatus Limnocylindrales bacterium]|nr:hypothetical protein [Candidatus Limnocylindrales bacterium]
MRLLAVLAALTIAGHAAAETDHLTCYKVKDPQAKAFYTAQLSGLTVASGCEIKVPAKLACVPTSKTISGPPFPPGGGGTGTPNGFFCYKVKCPKATLPTLAGSDQFGSRTVTPKATSLLCAPMAASTTATTTTTTTLGPACATNADCGADVCDTCVFGDCATSGTRSCAPQLCTDGHCASGATFSDPCTRGNQDGLVCTGGICQAGSCCTGCVSSGTCQPGTGQHACGANGDPCDDCGPPTNGIFCIAGICQ